MSADYRGYKRFFVDSWRELNKRFSKGEIEPQQERDIVCFLYYALMKRFERYGYPVVPKQIRTEDTFRLSKQHFLMCDMNINDRLFVEIKMFPLRRYKEGWKRRSQEIMKETKKLKRYVKEIKAKTAFKVRKPVLGIWFWKNDPYGSFPLEGKFVDFDLQKKLENLETQLKKENVTLLYGPSRFEK